MDHVVRLTPPAQYCPVVLDDRAHTYEPGAINTCRGSLRELNFWHYYVSQHGKEFTVPRPLVPYLAEIVRAHTRCPVTLLDIGAGAASQMGQILPGSTTAVTACDVLAVAYARIWQAARLSPWIRVEPADMAALPYRDHSFDVVHCANALDHAQNPFRSIQEMVRVSRSVVYLRHLYKQAKSSHYVGLHQWDIAVVGKDLRISRRAPPGNLFLLSECVPGFRVWYGRDVPEEGPKCIAVWEQH